MIAKFFNRGRGGGRGPTEYLLGREGDRPDAELVRGNPDEVRDLIDGLQFAKRYTSGVLSFAERLTPEQREQVIDSFERALLPDMEGRFSSMWVEHTEHDRSELHFVIPNVDLPTGKRLQPFYRYGDGDRIQAWQTIINAEMGLADPNEPKRKRTLVPVADLPRDKQEAVTRINSGLLAMAEAGAIKSRDDVVRALQDAGFTVARETKSSISIADPSGGKNIRLKGALYERSFSISQDLRGEIERSQHDYEQAAGERLTAARTLYESKLAEKREYLGGRYLRAQPKGPQPAAVEQPLGHAPGPDIGRVFGWRYLVGWQASDRASAAPDEQRQGEHQNGPRRSIGDYFKGPSHEVGRLWRDAVRDSGVNDERQRTDMGGVAGPWARVRAAVERIGEWIGRAIHHEESEWQQLRESHEARAALEAVRRERLEQRDSVQQVPERHDVRHQHQETDGLLQGPSP